MRKLLSAGILLILISFSSGCSSFSQRPQITDQEGEKLLLSLTMRASSDAVGADSYIFYLLPHGRTPYVFLLSVGHDFSGINALTSELRWSYVTPLVVLNTPTHDLSIGIIWDSRKVFNFFEIYESRPLPDADEKVITIAKPAQNDEPPGTQYLRPVREDDLNGKNKVCVSDDNLHFKADVEIRKGMSGAPVATTKGRVLGVLIGACRPDLTIYTVTPISKVMDALRLYIPK